MGVKVAGVFHTPALTLWMFFRVVPMAGKNVLLIGLFGFLTTWVVQVSGTVSPFAQSNISVVAQLKAVNKSGCFPAPNPAD